MQFQPHRLVFLSFALALCAFYYRASRKTQKILYYCGFLLCAFSVFWNVESGFICLAVWGGFLIYLAFMRNGLDGKKAYLHSLKTGFLSLASVFLAFAVLFLISYVKTGEVLPLKNILQPYLFFYKYGYMMLKMKFDDPWLLLGVIYLLALSKTLLALLRGEAGQKDLFLFISTVLGVTLFPYYQGRSHILVFYGICFPAVFILALFAQDYLEDFFTSLKDKTDEGRFFLCFSAAKFVLIFFFAAFMTAKVTGNLFISDKLFRFRDRAVYPILSQNSEIAQLFPPFVPVTLFTYDNAVYYTLRGQKDDAPLTEEYFTFEDYTGVVNYLALASRPIVFEKKVFDSFRKIPQKLFDEIIGENWQSNGSTEHFVSFVPKKRPLPTPR